jgi:putative nucleotidyltransferase with HDIG domain
MAEVVKIFAADLEPGMYISSLDRPWLETPFSLQGFKLKSQEEIHRLREYCKFVYVDTAKSTQDAAILRRKVRNRPRQSNQELFSDRTLKAYPDSVTWEEEYPRALRAVMVLSQGIDAIFGKMSKTGSLDMVTVKKCVEPMVESVARHPGACIWLARLKQEDDYTYQHPLCAAIWAVALGRQLGLPKTDLRSLAIGGLLFDIGKLGVPEELLDTTRQLTDEEFQQVRNHVKLGVDMIRGSALVNTDVIDMITHHHERHDGSGYPDGLRGDDIPIFARIASIVDCYDAITSQRSYARAIPPSTAVKMLYEWKDIDFQSELIEEFIQAVGVYPAGTLVELSTGEVAVVMEAYRKRRLRPRVLVLLDANKQALQPPRPLDLLAEKTAADGLPLEIRKSLEPNAHGIDMSTIPL